MAIGTASGAIKVLGQPGVEFYGHHSSNDIAVTRLIFIPNQGRLVSLCEDNSLHLWEINGSALEEVKNHSVEGKLKKVSALCLEGSQEHLLLGTEGGNVYLLNLTTFEMAQTIIYQDVVMQNVPEDYKINPGAVESMAIQPENPDNLLIGYNRGLMVLWDMKTPAAKHTYISTQGVESLCWKDARSFVSSHNDGSYAEWSVTTGEHEEPNTVYGPFPCKPITKIIALSEGMIVFSGGMQRASYSDRNTISVLDGERHVVFDFTSKVIDFFIAPSGEDTILVVLAEEELVALQLNATDWPMLPLPYLVSLHASAVTCSTYVSDVSQSTWDSLVAAGRAQVTGLYSTAAWPVDGGRLLETENTVKRRELLVTGHEDGSVRLWDVGDVAMTPLCKFSSTSILCVDDDDIVSPDHNDDPDEWPPFKKVGTFDPYSDDPRLAVKKVSLCPDTGTLVVAGTAGHVIVAKLSEEPQPEVKVVTMNIVSSRDGFVWKGHGALGKRNQDQIQSGNGFNITSLLQLHPPAAVTALALQSNWGLIAVGTAHGIALYDFIKAEPVIVKCTLNPLDMSGAGEGPISRRKSFKKSLRESFRRLRKGRSQRGGAGDKRAATTTAATSSPPQPTPSSPGAVDVETKPVERAIEARPVDDALGSMVRCITFARTYIISIQNMTPTLWVGTNNGTVYIFTLAVPGGTKRKDEAVSCLLGKEIQLKHRAPVVGISIMDGHCNSVDTSRRSEHPPPHKVLICSEEQIKIFTVPQLKPVCKMKLTALEGARVRRTILALFKAITTGNNQPAHLETCLLCLTNLGDIIVLSLPELRRQVNAAVIRKEDINGIFSLCFTERGEALYLHSSSELQRVSMSTTRVTETKCRIDLPPGVRPLSEDNVSQRSSDRDSIASSDSSSSSSSSSTDHSQRGDTKEETKAEAGDANRTEIKENGVSDSAHDLTMSSAGDITIDSVKDHLTNNVINSEERNELIRNETVKTESSVVTKTTVISSSESVITQQIVSAASQQPTESQY
ncbi:hypothetical protein O3M35_002038 [Rhynocoris fuscipes]|uniref:Lethal giant larvae homologue 2 domain-containing protein n=1 Tax=Rhynocoris fuscipes TaxID=488301 RepID=A0AAW1CTN7_9HEMI